MAEGHSLILSRISEILLLEPNRQAWETGYVSRSPRAAGNHSRVLTRSGPVAKKSDSQGGDDDVPMTGGQSPEGTVPEPAV